MVKACKMLTMNFVLDIVILICYCIITDGIAEKTLNILTSNYSATSIQCDDKHYCDIDCTLDMECAYSTIYCSQPDSICNIQCSGYKSCYYTTIISKSYNFTLSCNGITASSSTCYEMAVSVTFDGSNKSKTSSTNIGCKLCQSSSFYISNIDEIEINCLGSNGCQYARFIISDSNSVQMNCHGYYGCNSKINFGNNINSVNILCDDLHSCFGFRINTNNKDIQTNLICTSFYSCNNVHLSCFINKINSCMITCSEQSCVNMYVPVTANNYTKDFITFFKPTAVDNYIYMQCIKSMTNTIFHITGLTVINGSLECSDDVCCPFIQPVLHDIICEEESHCNISCVAQQNYTNCGVVNASKALSLNLQCINCISTQIICPKNEESICNITCLGSGCIDSSIHANYSKNVYLQCEDNAVCQHVTLYTKNNDSNVFIGCLENQSCSNMNVYAMTANHVSLLCNDCSSLNIFVPALSESTQVQCSASYSCESLTMNVYGIYQHQFTTFNCSEEYCGKVQFNCYTDSMSDPVSSYMTSNNTCSINQCCPFTHKHIKCQNINNTSINNNNCTVNCIGDYIKKNVTNGILCSSQYIHGANKINCIGPNACNRFIAFCPENNCNIDCVHSSTCYKAIINTNSTQESVINCFNYSCQYMEINLNHTKRTANWSLNCNGNSCCYGMTLIANYSNKIDINCFGSDACDYMFIDASHSKKLTMECNKDSYCYKMKLLAKFSNETEIKCIGDSSCKQIYVDVSGGGYINILSTTINYNYSSLELATINGTNASQLVLDCIGTFGQNACSSTNIFISENNTYLQCHGTACKNLSLYSNTSIITNKQLNVLINECQICSSSCIDEWNLYCGYHYSQHSTFNGITCSNNDCCDKNIFLLENDYNQCVNDKWEPIDNNTSEGIYYFGLSITILSAFSFLVMIVQFIYHRRYGEKHFPPLFIFGYIHITDFLMHINIFYLLFCFALTRVDLLWYCSAKYPIGDLSEFVDLSVLNSLCNNDVHCDMLGYKDRCHVNSIFNGLSITFYVFFGCYVPMHALFAWFVLANSIYRLSADSFVIRLHQISNSYVWKNEIILQRFKKIQFFGSYLPNGDGNIYRIIVWSFCGILYGIAVFSYIFTEFYYHCQWFVLYVVIFVFIMAQLLKLYYRSLVPYNENENENENSLPKKQKLLSNAPSLKSSKYKP